jgi:AraC-like DNA-binding protein
MHLVESIPASLSLRRYVRAYAQRTVRPTRDAFVEPVPARLEQVLEFEFDDSFQVRFLDGHTIEAPQIALIGWQTHLRAEIQFRGSIQSFAVFFWPSGVFHLFGIPAEELKNKAYDASSVLGHRIRLLWNELGEAHSFRDRVPIVERYLQQWVGQIRTDEIATCADQILAGRGLLSIDSLAQNMNITRRHLERRFKSQVGLSPKSFSRIARFQTALDLKVAHPEISWLNTAHALGYYDQMHMIHDFRSLCGVSPNAIFSRIGNARPKAVASDSDRA